MTRKPDSVPKKPSMTTLLPRLLALVVIMAILLFLPAGRLDWLQAWASILAFSSFVTSYALWIQRNDPEQLKERSQVGMNTKGWDKVILMLYTILLLAMPVLSGLDAVRFKWARVPMAVQMLGWLGAVFAGYLIFRTGMVNTYLSRTARIQDDRGQKVIDSGPYALVRHPMYLGVIALMLSIPLLLGSFWSLIPGGLIGVLFVIRTALEDRMLAQELPGYQEYSQRVRYRIIPGIW